MFQCVLHLPLNDLSIFFFFQFDWHLEKIKQGEKILRRNLQRFGGRVFIVIAFKKEKNM